MESRKNFSLKKIKKNDENEILYFSQNIKKHYDDIYLFYQNISSFNLDTSCLKIRIFSKFDEEFEESISKLRNQKPEENLTLEKGESLNMKNLHFFLSTDLKEKKYTKTE